MGRLSEARKKAQAKKEAAGEVAALPIAARGPKAPEAAPMPALEVAPEAAPIDVRTAAEPKVNRRKAEKPVKSRAPKAKDQALVDEEAASRPVAAVEVMPAAETDADEIAWVAAALAEADEVREPREPRDVAAAKPASRAAGKLPASGLAEDILRDMEQASAASNAKAEDNLDEPLEWGILEALSREEKAGKAAGPVSLPSSGMADDILALSAGTAGKRSLSLDEIHEFENFFEDEVHEESAQYVLFSVAREVFGVEIEEIREVLRVPVLTRVPNSSRDILGVFNLRGRIVPLFDLRKLLNLPGRPIDKESRILILEAGARLVSVLIDRVREVVRIDLRDIEPTPEEIALVDRNMVSAVARNEDQMIFLLDLRTVVGGR